MRFRRGLIAAAAFWGLLAAAASAQEEQEYRPAEGPGLGAAEVRAAILGYHLSGEVVGGEGAWSECIDPEGRTWWRMEDFVSQGRVEVKSDGQACFRYSHTQFRREVCWTMRREGSGEGERLRFDLVNGDSLPLVVTARRKVASCPGDGPMA
ncbi:MAG: hypothetical protein JNJ73_10945 [Hyphomonadaceae bacterium]|nr:hypothetical protein [Hyphomonadaceae bacterium]